jgi:hypothetical protein
MVNVSVDIERDLISQKTYAIVIGWCMELRDGAMDVVEGGGWAGTAYRYRSKRRVELSLPWEPKEVCPLPDADQVEIGAACLAVMADCLAVALPLKFPEPSDFHTVFDRPEAVS